jgi:hypothetical protein
MKVLLLLACVVMVGCGDNPIAPSTSQVVVPAKPWTDVTYNPACNPAIPHDPVTCHPNR